MFDTLYENIGGKVKSLAKFMFVIEAISAIITGISLMFADEYLIFAGLLTLFLGPIVAWVSSWIVYAIGEAADSTRTLQWLLANGYITKQDSKTEEPAETEKTHASASTSAVTSIPCSKCGEIFSGLYCPICGQKASTSVATPATPSATTLSHVCMCGNRFYGDTCPRCGRSVNDVI